MLMSETIKESVNESVKKSILAAVEENREDLRMAQEECDYEEQRYCEGYEQALYFVMTLLGIKSEN